MFTFTNEELSDLLWSLDATLDGGGLTPQGVECYTTLHDKVRRLRDESPDYRLTAGRILMGNIGIGTDQEGKCILSVEPDNRPIGRVGSKSPQICLHVISDSSNADDTGGLVFWRRPNHHLHLTAFGAGMQWRLTQFRYKIQKWLHGLGGK